MPLPSSLTQQHLKRHPEKRKHFRRVRIWSGQWSAWWLPPANGYTNQIDEAAVYDIEDAWEHVFHCGPEKKIVIQAA